MLSTAVQEGLLLLLVLLVFVIASNAHCEGEAAQPQANTYSVHCQHSTQFLIMLRVLCNGWCTELVTH